MPSLSVAGARVQLIESELLLLPAGGVCRGRDGRCDGSADTLCWSARRSGIRRTVYITCEYVQPRHLVVKSSGSPGVTELLS